MFCFDDLNLSFGGKKSDDRNSTVYTLWCAGHFSAELELELPDDKIVNDGGHPKW
jgi:hypothetical protein